MAGRASWLATRLRQHVFAGATARGSDGYSPRSGKTQALATEVPHTNIAQTEASPASHLKLVVNEPEPLVQPMDDIKPEAEPSATPWDKFMDAVHAEGPEIEALRSSTFVGVEDTTVQIQCTAGRTASMAKRALAHPEIVRAMQDIFGPDATIHIDPIKPIRALTKDERIMEEVKRSPAIARIEQAFQVEITKITTRDNGDET